MVHFTNTAGDQNSSFVPYGKVTLCVTVAISPKETTRQTVRDAELLSTAFDEKTGIFTLTAKVPAPYFTGTKFSWIQENFVQEGSTLLHRTVDIQEARKEASETKII